VFLRVAFRHNGYTSTQREAGRVILRACKKEMVDCIGTTTFTDRDRVTLLAPGSGGAEVAETEPGHNYLESTIEGGDMTGVLQNPAMTAGAGLPFFSPGRPNGRAEFVAAETLIQANHGRGEGSGSGQRRQSRGSESQ